MQLKTVAERAPSRTPSLIVIGPTRFAGRAVPHIASDVPPRQISDHQQFTGVHGARDRVRPHKPTKFAARVTKVTRGELGLSWRDPPERAGACAASADTCVHLCAAGALAIRKRHARCD